jgi:hypothetical protein
MQQHSQPESIFDTPAQSFNLLYALSSVYAACVLPFLRTGMGSHALGMSAFLALVLMMTVGGLMNAPAILNYVAAWLAAVIIQRVLVLLRGRRNGEPVHSRYLGDPLLARFPSITVNAARGVLEPMLTFIAAMLLGAWSQDVAGFLMGAAVALFIKNVIDLEADRARVRRMRDAHIEQVYVSRTYRKVR